MSEIGPLLATRLSKEIGIHYGIITYPRPNGHIIMSRREWQVYWEAVWSDRRIDAVGRGYYLGAVQFDVQPDWMFNPFDVAIARLTAILIRDLRLRTIVDWLARTLTPKENPHG